MNLCNASDVGMKDVCCCCGGWVYAAGNLHPVPGSVPALVYCSLECRDDWEDFLAAQDAQRAARKAFNDWEDALYAAR